MDHSKHSGEQQHSSKVLRFHSSAGAGRPHSPQHGNSRRAGDQSGEATSHRPAADGCVPKIEFRNVSFHDAASGQAFLTNLSFHVRPRARVGVLGPSGSGKINLLNLLTRFQEPSAGAILLDGKDVREFKLDELNRQFSIVPHDPMLLADSVAANIAWADPQASRSEVVRAAKLANAHELIESLPHGYETSLGEGGATLSAGERHLLAIARAFLKNAPILILDEPAGGEDPAIEQLIMDALARLMAGRTSLTMAYRISALERCDMVLVLRNGFLDAICTGTDYAKAPRTAAPVPDIARSSVGRIKPGPILVRMEEKSGTRPPL